MSLLPEPLLPAPCRRDRAPLPCGFSQIPSLSLIRSFRFSGGIVRVFHAARRNFWACSGLMASWSRVGGRVSGQRPSVPGRPCQLPHRYTASQRLCPCSPRSLAAPAAAVAFSRLTSAAFGRASLLCFPTGLPPILLNPPLSLSPTELSNGRALLAAEGETCTDCVLLCKH